ncbi:MAG TPA: VOC family protein [Acidobacteriota bacterium]|nr:VOC family protein [Acidobacteriota bacterium]
MNQHEKINYVELPAKDLAGTKAFFESVFGWSFTDYGPEYTAFENQGLDGGFFQSDLVSSTENGAALIVFYSSQLEATLAKVEKAGGSILKPIYSFPGGRRFHFAESSRNEFAVWGE